MEINNEGEWELINRNSINSVKAGDYIKTYRKDKYVFLGFVIDIDKHGKYTEMNITIKTPSNKIIFLNCCRHLLYFRNYYSKNTNIRDFMELLLTKDFVKQQQKLK